MPKPDFEELLPELRSWRDHNGPEFDERAWISCVGSFDHAIGYGLIFWPELHVYDDCVFVSRVPVEDNYRKWLDTTKGDKSGVEAVLNHQHITDLFQVGGHLQFSQDQIVYLGKLIRDMWETKAMRDFPERRIRVTFNEGAPDDLYEYQVTLFQDRE